MATKNNQYSKTVYLIDGNRTPFLKARGRPGPFKHADLAIAAARPVLQRMPFQPENFDEVIMGSTMPGPDEANIARILALRIGCGDLVPAYTVHRNCASGMQAIDNAAMSIAAGRSDLVLAGGIESMSHAPLLFHVKAVHWLADWWTARSFGRRLQVLKSFSPRLLAPVISLLKGLTDPVIGLNMGQTAEKIAHRFGITRSQMDQFAVDSHLKLYQAQQDGHLDEIVPLFDDKGNLFQYDDGVRPDSTIEKLAKLRPAFDKPFGTVTPGNSAQITDGAAIVVLASEAAVKKYNLPIMAKIITTEWAALSPSEMGLGPAHAIAPLLKSQKLKVSDIDYWEINEAFAAQVLAVVEALKSREYCSEHLGSKTAIGEIPVDRINIHGGGVSLGHPVGASGARILLHLAHVLKQKNARRGIASLCIGGGQGGAMLIEIPEQASASNKTKKQSTETNTAAKPKASAKKSALTKTKAKTKKTAVKGDKA